MSLFESYSSRYGQDYYIKNAIMSFQSILITLSYASVEIGDECYKNYFLK